MGNSCAELPAPRPQALSSSSAMGPEWGPHEQTARLLLQLPPQLSPVPHSPQP